MKIGLLAFFLVSLFLAVGCGSHSQNNVQTGAKTDDQENLTGGKNADGLAYTGYNTSDDVSDLKQSVQNNEQNKAFAQQITDANISAPKSLDPTVQQQIQQLGDQQEGVPQLPPIEVDIQMKTLPKPLVFQGVLSQGSDGKYHTNMIETSGQQPNLQMAGECDDTTCDHGEFLLTDADNRQAAIEITKEKRTIHYKVPVDPLANEGTAPVPADLKQDQKVQVSSLQVVSGISKAEIDRIDDQGNVGPAIFKTDLTETDNCPTMYADKSTGLQSACLFGNSGNGDLLIKGTLAGTPSTPAPTTPPPTTPQKAPTTNPPATNPTKPTTNPQNNSTQPPTPPPAPATVSTGSDDTQSDVGPQTVFFEISRDTDSTTATAPADGQCPISITTSNPYLTQIMKDCMNTYVVSMAKSYWGPPTHGRNANGEMVRFLGIFQRAQLGTVDSETTNLKKALTALGNSDLPKEMIFESVEESGFTANAISTEGAMGWWQFMPNTGKGLGLHTSPDGQGFGDYADITKSTKAYISLFDSNLKRWDGDVKMAIASYERGPGGNKLGSGGGVAGLITSKVQESWKNDPTIPEDLKIGYSLDKSYWFIHKYYTTHRVAVKDSSGKTQMVLIDMSYVPKVLGAIMVGLAPDYYKITDTKGNSLPGLEDK